MTAFNKKKIFLIIFVIELLALGIGIKDFLDAGSFDGKLQRPAPGEIETIKDMSVSSSRGAEDINVKISPMARTLEESQALIEAAKAEIDETIAGNNRDLDHVTENISPKNSYQEGRVKAEWSFDDYSVIDQSGKIKLEMLTEKKLIRARCTLTCEDLQETYMFSMMLLPPDVSTDNGYRYLLKKSLEEADNETRDEKTFTLPESTGELKLAWKEKSTNRGILLGVLGIVVLFALKYGGKEEKKNQEKKRQKEMERDYPDIVSMLSLYVGAGISVKSAMQKIAENYRERLKEGESIRPGFEGVIELTRQMEDGKEEIESYKDFGKRMKNKDYRKLSIMLSQNLRKGNAGLSDQLEKEEHQAFEDRKLRAKLAGEEASTKLLIPMMALLMIVLVVLIFPAMQGMDI